MTWILLNTLSVVFVHTHSGVPLAQTRTQSLFMCFLGERRLGVRLRRAGSHAGKVRRKTSVAIFPSYLPRRPRAPHPNPQSSLTPKTYK